MDLKNAYQHKRGTSVKVDGKVYQIGEDGIARNVDPVHARKLMGDKKAWMILRQPVELVADDTRPEVAAVPEPAPVEVPPVLEAPLAEKVPTEPMVEAPQPMPGPGPELTPTGAAEAALTPEKPQVPVAPKPAPEPPAWNKKGSGRPRK